MRAEFDGRRFVFRPRPAHDEHVLSYLLRLGEMNGYTGRKTLGRFTRSIMMRIQQSTQIASVAKLVDLHEHVLRELAHRHEHVSDVRPRPNRLSTRYLFRAPHVAYCPACIHERGLFKAIWNFRAVSICEAHASWLVERCPRCTALVGWDRPGPTSCICGFDLGQADTTKAPAEAVLINKLISDAVLGIGESDLHEAQLFCAEARRMRALEWLATCDFLATLGEPLRRRYSMARARLDAEKRATTLAAKWFSEWPTNAMRDLNESIHRVTGGWSPPLISTQQFNERIPTRWTRYGQRRLALPNFMTCLIQSYAETLTVHRKGCGLVVNPDRVISGVDETFGVCLKPDSAANSVSHSGDEECIPLSRLVEGLRQTNIVLYERREVEQLIGVTKHQRRSLNRCGFLRYQNDKRFTLSSEVDRLWLWLRDNSVLATAQVDTVPLSKIARMGGTGLGRVLVAVKRRDIPLFRLFENGVSLDTCFIKKASLTALAELQRD